MNRPSRLTFTLTALALIGALALPVSAAAAEQRAALTDRISLDTADGTASGAFKMLSELLGSRLELDPEVAERKLTVTLQNVRVSLVLDTLCDSLSCRWRLEASESGGGSTLEVSNLGPPYVRPPVPDVEALLAEPISIELKGAAFDEVMQSFATMLGAKLELDPKLAGGEVSVSLTNTRLEDALDTLVGRAPYHWKFEEQNGRRVLKVWRE